MLKITDDELTPVELGNSDRVEQGDVIAIGSPYNYDFSVTFGIICQGAWYHIRRGIGDYVPYLQTDAVNREIQEVHYLILMVRL